MLLRAAALRSRRQWSSTSTMQSYEKFESVLKAELKSIEEAGTFKSERIIESEQRASISVGGAQVLNFCANNYLGLSDNKVIIDAAKRYLDTRGFGMSSVRFICGTQDVHRDLEVAIAKFHRKEAAIAYASCFDANAGIFEALLGTADAVVSDELNHASIIDGVRLSKAQRFRFKHMDCDDLDERLREADDGGARLKMVVTDGVFSMDGDIAPLDRICDVAERHNALVVVDECHATGFLGATGRGTPEHCGVMDRVDVVNSTLGKALGGATGGYTTGPKELVELLRQRSRPYLFSNALAPSLAGASLAVFDLIESDSSLREALHRNTEHFRTRMTEAGFKLAGNGHPIVPVMLGDARLAAEFADDMLQLGIYVIGFSYPVVPKGKARIRVQLSAAHTTEQVDQAIDAFIQVGKKRHVID
jgi:glycine C-acetyltransferase